MNKELETINLMENMNIRLIHDDKFKTGKISITMLLPLKTETVASNAILPFLLKRSTKKYPTFIELNKKLSMMYGATIFADVKKIGDTQALTLGIVGIDRKYTLEDENITKEITEMLIDVIFNPNIENNKFSSNDIAQEKREIIDVLDSELNDKREYSKNRLIELMCKDEPYGINPLGTKELIEKVTNEDIINAYQRAKYQSQIEVIVLGISNSDSVIDSIKSAFKNSKSNNVSLKTNTISQIEKVREYKDTFDVAQSKLVIGLRANEAVPSDGVMATMLMTAIFGGTPSSKLFMNVREKLSLCYYCSASYLKNKGIILIQSGVEHKNIKKAKNEILKQLDDMKQGNITEDEINSAKLSIINSFKTTDDSLSSLENYYISQVFDKKMITPIEKSEIIRNITKDQIIKSAQKVKLDTIYVLTKQDEKEVSQND